VGAAVRAGDLLDYVGDSGNAESTPSHLHFELHRPGGIVVNPYPHLLGADGVPRSRVESALATTDVFGPATSSTAVVGYLDPGDGFAAGIAVHNDIAYLGAWGRPEACPAPGVRVIDVADPVDPQAVGAIASGEEFPETDTDSVWAGLMETDTFTGDVAVVAVSLCDNSERSRRGDDFRGLAIYDVTDPAHPELLSTYFSGSRTQGVHEVDVVVREDGRVLAAATVMQSLLHTEGMRGDVRLIDITNPKWPRETANWDYRRDVLAGDGAAFFESDAAEQMHAHSATFTGGGERLWVSHWDAGAMLLDVSNPYQPELAIEIVQLASAEGNVHSAVSDAGMGVVVLSSEDLYPETEAAHEAGWGYQTILDLTGRQLGVYAAGIDPSADDPTVPLDGYHTAHNAELVDGVLYSSWYSSGLRIVDLSNPTEPTEIGYFIPPPTADPQNYWVAPDGSDRMAMVWDVYVDGELVYVSDMNTGLWIVRRSDEDIEAYEPF
jgi:hypothetical protein